MSIVVEHEKRRREILERALDVFMDEGFEDVTYQKIADRCGITRTTLYIYFKNKGDIFNFSIKQFLQNLEENFAQIRKEEGLSHNEKLIMVLTMIINSLEENHRLLSVIVNSLLNGSKEGHDPDYRVRRRTVRLRHILSTMLIEGIKAGEFRRSVNVKEANELLYSLIETAVLRLVVLRRSSVDELVDAMKLAVSGFAVKS
ncbi:MAG: TetR/AcrR family transcriptional regulator [Treponema sp.]|nr:TetR/AcrR family transcriptional regulator [Treponema sp.]